MKRYIYAALALVVLASCNKIEELEPTQSPQDDVILLGAAAATRASDSSWAQGDKIGVFMNSSNSSSLGSLADNVLYTASNSGSSTELSSSTPLYYPQSGNVDIYAYYPYSSSYDGLIDVSDQSDLSKIDFMVAHVDDVAKSRDLIDLNFKHMLAKINITIKGEGAITTDRLKALTCDAHNIKSKARYSQSEGLVATSEYASAFGVAVAANGQSAELLVVPDMTIPIFAFTVQGYGTFQVYAKTVTFKSGYTYDYEVTLTHPATRSADGEHTGTATMELVNEYPTN